MVLYILTGYQVLSIVYLDQLLGTHHAHISYKDTEILPQSFTIKILPFKLAAGISKQKDFALKISSKLP